MSDEHETRYPSFPPLWSGWDIGKALDEWEQEEAASDESQEALERERNFLDLLQKRAEQVEYHGQIHHLGKLELDGELFDAWAPLLPSPSRPFRLQSAFEEFVRTGKTTQVKTVVINSIYDLQAQHVLPSEPKVEELQEEIFEEMGDPYFLALLDKLADIHRRKAAGYGGYSDDTWANFREATSLGMSPVQGVLLRMSDKWSRIKSLRKNPANEQVGEAIEDTLIDLASYALIAICLLNEEHIDNEELT